MIKGLVIMVSVLMTLSVQAYAIHPLPQWYPFNNANQTICYDTNSLNDVKFNGQTGQGNALKNEIDKGRKHVSDNTDINISVNCPSNNYITASAMQSYVDGRTYVFNANQPNQYKVIHYNKNVVDYRTDYICIPTADLTDMANPKFIAIHEFGHFAGLDHPTSEFGVLDYHIVMKRNCNQGYASLSTDDKSQINGFY